MQDASRCSAAAVRCKVVYQCAPLTSFLLSRPVLEYCSQAKNVAIMSTSRQHQHQCKKVYASTCLHARIVCGAGRTLPTHAPHPRAFSRLWRPNPSCPPAHLRRMAKKRRSAEAQHQQADNIEPKTTSSQSQKKQKPAPAESSAPASKSAQHGASHAQAPHASPLQAAAAAASQVQARAASKPAPNPQVAAAASQQQEHTTSEQPARSRTQEQARAASKPDPNPQVVAFRGELVYCGRWFSLTLPI